jgi:hypothetical protein
LEYKIRINPRTCWHASLCIDCQVQEVKQVSDKYLQWYTLVLDNPKMTTLSWKEQSAPFSNPEAHFSLCGCLYTLSSTVGWITKYQMLHRREQAPSAPGVQRWEHSACNGGESRDEPCRANQILAGWGHRHRLGARPQELKGT